ncbi:unnamed protein product [Caenorhabditis angaria]|uniref:Uncharacterized protein n=1 Tax=Caenorhabditis angaria TaxID=860376 RepID=A0A9P1IQ14_9PELO|nr:unnamed protein product [Caenorhabditis angaria]
MQLCALLFVFVILVSSISASIYDTADDTFRAPQQLVYPKRGSLSNMMRIGKRNYVQSEYPCDNCNLGALIRLGK